MNEIITRLNEIEEKANAIIEDAAARKTQLENQLKQEKKEMDDRFAEAERRRLSELEAQWKEEAEKQMTELKQQNEEAMKSLKENFDRNQEEMADEIFRKIIG